MAKTIGQLTAVTSAGASDEVPISVSSVTNKITVANLVAAALGLTGNKTVAEGTNLVLGTSTGTKIGTATNQKLGFFNATPAVQPALTADLLDSLQTLGLIASGSGNTPLDLTSGALTAGAANVASLTSTGAISGTALTATTVTGSGAIKSSSATGGVGYTTGAGGTVTQTTDKSTGVTLNKACGTITMAAGSIGNLNTATFTLTNSAIAAGDLLVLNHVSGGTAGAYSFNAQCGAGSAAINVTNVSGGSLNQQPVIAFAVIKGVTA